MKKLLSFAILFVVSAAAILFTHPGRALAFNANNLMDDGIFDNANTMTAVQIDAWLNSNFPNSCISTNHGFGSVEPTGYNPTNGYLYNNIAASAGVVIYDAAQAYGVNPQVLLATLQKEQSLVTGSAGCSTLQYVGAMGYGCPDGGTTHSYPAEGTPPSPLYWISGGWVTSVNGTCVSGALKVGFTEQVIHAAWLLAYDRERSEGNTSWAIIKGSWDNSDDPPSCYPGNMTQGNRARSTSANPCPSSNSPPGNQVFYYDGYTTIDSTSVYLTNGATASLYRYTPHFPGNQNFDNIFQSWFGSLYDIYAWSVVGQYAFTDNTKTTPVDLTNLTVGQKVYVGFQAKNTGTATWSNTGSNPVRVGTSWPQDRTSSFCDTSDSPSWAGCNRPATMIEASAAPGQVGTFEFWYQAPNQVSTFDEHFSLLSEGLKWMNDPGLYFHTATKSPTWSVVGQYAFTDNTKTTPVDLTNLLPGQRVFIGFYAKNTSGIAWTNSAGSSTPVRAGTTTPNDRISAFCDPTWPACNRPATSNESSIPPGGTATFEFWYKVPSVTGTYMEYFKPVIDGISWMNDTGMNFYTVVRFDTSGTSTTLGSNQILNTGQSIISSDGRYRLIMQSDGNLVLYSINRALWSSHTAGKPAVKAIMQSDGNLVIYDTQNTPFWASNTAGRGVSSLIVQTDGNLVIYDTANHPTWATYTQGQL